MFTACENTNQNSVMESSLEVHKWLKIEFQYDPSVPLFGIYSGNPCPIIRDICAFMCFVSLFMIIRKWNPLRYPSTEWKGKCGVYIHNGIVFNQKEKWNNEIFGKMNGLRKYSINGGDTNSESKKKTLTLHHLHSQAYNVFEIYLHISKQV